MGRHWVLGWLGAWLVAGMAWAGDAKPGDESSAAGKTEKPSGVVGEFCGKVVIERSEGKPPVVKIVPRNGEALRVLDADAGQWKARESRWVEVEGRFVVDDGKPAMSVRKIQTRKKEPGPKKPDADVDGVLQVNGDKTLRVKTSAGSLRLRDDTIGKQVKALGDGRLVEVEGTLFVENGKLAMRVVQWKTLKKLDDDDDNDDDNDDEDEDD